MQPRTAKEAGSVALAEMYGQGVSTRTVIAIVEQWYGSQVSNTQVSRAAELDTALAAWRSQPLGEYRYLLLNARYEKVRVNGAVRDMAVLIAVGIDPTGHRAVLGGSVSLSEAEAHWRDFLSSLVQRGLSGCG